MLSAHLFVVTPTRKVQQQHSTSVGIREVPGLNQFYACESNISVFTKLVHLVEHLDVHGALCRTSRRLDFYAIILTRYTINGHMHYTWTRPDGGLGRKIQNL